jgi:hypothetical protein
VTPIYSSIYISCPYSLFDEDQEDLQLMTSRLSSSTSPLHLHSVLSLLHRPETRPSPRHSSLHHLNKRMFLGLGNNDRFFTICICIYLSPCVVGHLVAASSCNSFSKGSSSATLLMVFVTSETISLTLVPSPEQMQLPSRSQLPEQVNNIEQMTSRHNKMCLMGRQFLLSLTILRLSCPHWVFF